MTLRFNAHQSTGNFNTVASGSAVSGNTLFVGGTYRKAGDVVAVLALTAATSTITFAARWQVSNDASTWINAASSTQNAAAVVLVTGTAAAATFAVPAPSTINGFKYARVQVVVGGTTGQTADLYTIGYSYRQLTGAETR